MPAIDTYPSDYADFVNNDNGRINDTLNALIAAVTGSVVGSATAANQLAQIALETDGLGNSVFKDYKTDSVFKNNLATTNEASVFKNGNDAALANLGVFTGSVGFNNEASTFFDGAGRSVFSDPNGISFLSDNAGLSALTDNSGVAYGYQQIAIRQFSNIIQKFFSNTTLSGLIADMDTFISLNPFYILISVTPMQLSTDTNYNTIVTYSNLVI